MRNKYASEYVPPEQIRGPEQIRCDTGITRSKLKCCAASKSASSRLKEALLHSVVQKLDREVGLRVAAKRLPKSSSWESRLSVEGSRR